MKDLLEKYTQLNEDYQKEVIDFISFLLNKQEKPVQFDMEAYRKAIQAVSVWPEEAITPILEAKEHLNNWKTTEW
jgi:hypothetical protein